MKGKLFGGILLIIGTSIGGAMLALPMATAAAGYVHSLFLFVSAWLVTMLAAFYLLEVSLWLPKDTNLVSMAKSTLGLPGQMITWLCDLILLYALLSAYTAGGSELLANLLLLINIHLPTWLDSILFITIFGTILFFGVRVVDFANRGLMTIKLTAYLLLIVLISPHVNITNLTDGSTRMLGGAVMVVITSFGYATIIPTLRTYFDGKVNYLRLAIGIGSCIPLVCYLIWNFAVQGALNSQGASGLVAIASSGNSVAALTNALSTKLNSQLISGLAHLFTAICITTSFLGVSLCLADFCADGFKIKKQGWGRLTITLIVLVPPLLIVLLNPSIFVSALAFAGICCVILLMLLPALMVFSGRYVKKIATGYQVIGGKWFIAFEIIIATALLISGIWHLHPELIYHKLTHFLFHRFV